MIEETKRVLFWDRLNGQREHMIILYIWARDLSEACEDVKHGFGYNSLLQAKANKPPANFPKLFKVTINAKEIE